MRRPWPIAITLALAVGACAPGPPGSTDRREVLLAATTSVQDSGLLDALVRAFEAESSLRLRASVQGTGAALSLGARGQVDVLLTHEPRQELAFMEAGSGKRRVLVMHNEFVLVGSPADPAAARGRSIDDAFRAIAASGVTFVSRGDRSGTDVAEKSVWGRIGVTPKAPWYIESGTGQAQSLVVASERKAYMLVDSGTFLSHRSSLALELLVEPRPRLINPYHAITVDPAKFPRVNARGADAFVDFLLSSAGQRLIGEHGRDRYGTPLFTPAAGLDEGSLR